MVREAVATMGRSLAALRQPRWWLGLVGLVVLAVALGIWAYQPPLSYHISIGGADAQYIRNLSERLVPTGSHRWLREQSSIVIPGLSDAHPYTLSVQLNGAERPDVAAGQVVSFTLNVGGTDYPSQPLTNKSQQYTWRVEGDAVKQGKLTLTFTVPAYYSGSVIAPIGMRADALDIVPAAPVADYAELDWRNVIYLALLAALLFSFFMLLPLRWAWLLGLVLSGGVTLGLVALLRYNRPLFVVYASTAVLALLLIRLAWPLLANRPATRPLRWLLLFTLATSLFFALPAFQSGDDVLKYLTAESIVQRGSLQLPPPQTDPNVDIGIFSRYALGHSFALTPLVAVGTWFEQLLGGPPQTRYFFVMLFNPLVTTLTVAMLFLCLRRLYRSERLALALCLVYFGCTIALVYAVASWTEPLLGLLILTAFYAMLRHFDSNETHRWRWLLLGGVALGYASTSKEEYLLPAGVFSLWWLVRRLWELRQEQRTITSVLGRLVAEGVLLAVPIAALYSIHLAYNYIRTSSIISSGYNAILGFDKSLLGSWYGLLFSSGKGLLLYAPPLLLGAWAVRGFWQRFRWEAILIGALFVVAIWFYGAYIYWEGGVSWGPRFMLPYLGLLLIVSGAALQPWAQWQRWQRWGYALLLLAGGWVNLLGLLTNMGEDWNYGYNYTGEINWFTAVVFSPYASPLAHAWRLVERGYVQPQAMFQLSYYGFPSILDHVVPAVLFAGLVIGVMRVVVVLRPEPTPAQ